MAERTRQDVDGSYSPLPAKTATVAELGCRSARLLARIVLERPDLKLVAVDYEQEANNLVRVSAHAYGVTFETSVDEGNNLKFADNSFELVSSGGLLEHFGDPKPALREMVRTLKPGGGFYAAIVPRNKSFWHHCLKRR